ncbi:MAG TPA: hypothetical protein PK771_07485 [Spirochaetota bacterium]|nr:hypothetical protein [Spirochaetota bacterium]
MTNDDKIVISANLEKRVKKHIKGKNHNFFGIVSPGLENIAFNELKSLGVSDIGDVIKGGIEFQSKIVDCYKVNLSSRILTRVLLRLSDFKATNFRVLYNKVKLLPWELYLSNGININFNVETSQSRLYHTGGIEDAFIKGINEKVLPFNIDINFDKDNNDSLTVFVRIVDDRCFISLDTTGEPLYKRGEKVFVSEAPLRETFASAILFESEIENMDILIDPMCGSGTFSIEGYGIRNFKIPGVSRKFSFEKFPSFSEKSYNHLKKSLLDLNSDKRKNNTKILQIITSDKDKKMVDIASKNFKNIGIIDSIQLSDTDFFNLDYTFPKDKKSLIVINPPYGKRLHEKNVIDLYNKISLKLKKSFSSSSYAVIIPGSITSKINLPYDKCLKFKHGGIEVDVRIKINQTEKDIL